jgi:putative acetyltransferase
VVGLGSEAYYPRFGFGPAAHYGIRFQDAAVPEEHFMVIELRRGALADHPGVACYEPEFNEV